MCTLPITKTKYDPPKQETDPDTLQLMDETDKEWVSKWKAKSPCANF